MKKLFKYSVFFILGIVILFFVALLFLYLVPPKSYQALQIQIPDEIAFNLDSKTGWYRDSSSNEYLISYGAEGGLYSLQFPIRPKWHHIKSLKPLSKDILLYEVDNEIDSFKFIIDNTHHVTSFQVHDEKGLQLEALKIDSLYYGLREIEYYNGDVLLKGTLFIPFSDHPLPFISMIHGSGISDRNNYWYQYQANYLARQGIIVLLPDKRGCGKSQGEWHTASFEDFADDISAGIKHVREELNLNISKTGVIGLSQGGWISHLVSKKSNNIEFIVDVVSSATTPNEQLRHEIRADLKRSGVPSFLISIMEPIFTKRAKLKKRIWWKKNGEYNPIQFMSTSNLPILKIFGKKDEDDNVPVTESLSRINNIIDNYPELALTVKLYEDSGHAMEDPKTGWIRSDYLDFIISWINNI